jgi:hypothetical protein
MERLPDGGRSNPVLAGEVVGHGLFQLAPRDVSALRRRTGPTREGWEHVPPSVLRYSDEQTIAGTAAVLAAMSASGLPPERFEGWGVVAASRYLGRANLALALRSFAAEGVWGVSPHLIPHFALHSPSGTISLAVGLHGPNLGVGGGLHATAEGFLAALTWLASGIVPGVWLVLTGWVPEFVPERRAGDGAAGECRALALALVAPRGEYGGRPLVRIVAGRGSRLAPATPDLQWLVNCLERPGDPRPRSIAADPSGHVRVELVPGQGRTVEDAA